MQASQATLGVPTVMQPWSCEEDSLASEFSKKEKEKKKERKGRYSMFVDRWTQGCQDVSPSNLMHRFITLPKSQ